MAEQGIVSNHRYVRGSPTSTGYVSLRQDMDIFVKAHRCCSDSRNIQKIAHTHTTGCAPEGSCYSRRVLKAERDQNDRCGRGLKRWATLRFFTPSFINIVSLILSSAHYRCRAERAARKGSPGALSVNLDHSHSLGWPWAGTDGVRK